MNIQLIAQIAHNVNTAYCHAIGDTSAVTWDNASDDQKASMQRGVQFALDNPNATPVLQHEAWLKDKLDAGWKYGPTKDADKKEHPCCLPYDELPTIQKAKDSLFRSIVSQLAPLIEAEEEYHM